MIKWSIIIEILKESLNFAWTGLRNNVLRTLLSTMAITIGIFMIIAILTFIDSLNKNIKDSVSQLGGGVIYVQKWPWLFDNEYPWWKFVNRPQVDYNEMQILQKKLRNCKAVSMTAGVYGRTISTGKEQMKQTGIDFITHDYNKVFDLNFANGRYFTEYESRVGEPVIILGSKLALNLFPDEDPLGKYVRAVGKRFRVIGVLDKEGYSSISASQMDQRAFVPFNFARYLYGSNLKYLKLAIEIKGKEKLSEEKIEDEVRGVMRSIRRLSPREEDNFALNRASLINEKLNDIFGSLSIVGWILAAFSILVGGFGTANIMFVSVKERTFLIGIEKALGSPKYFILAQFLGEAIILCIIGGLIGLLLVVSGIVLVNVVQDDIRLILTMKNVILGLSLSTFIGIIAGLIPAYRASRLDPIVAIRSHF